MFTLLVLLLLIIAYYFLKRNYDYWERKGVPGPKPTFFVGNVGATFLMKRSMGEIFTDIYNKYQDLPFVGAYRAGTPVLILRDPELIKDITIKQFSYFHDNDINIDTENDALFGRNPFALRGEQWKIVRTQLTPCFTSGKMKSIFPLLDDISKQLIAYIDKESDVTNSNGFEAKELCTKFTLNNIASCAFGLEGKCFENPNSEIRILAHEFLSPGGWMAFKLFLLTLLPSAANLLSIKLTSKAVEQKLSNIVTTTLKYREENNIIRNDFLHIISQLKKTCKEYEFTDIDVTAHAAGFIADGFETSSAVMSFVLYELACNPEVQSKLRQEIVAKFIENNDNLTYEAVQDMSYLDAVINESLRKYPALFNLAKLCTSPYNFTFNKENKKMSFTVEPGTPIILPIYALQNDPKYFPDPDNFIPERFLLENKENLTKCTFLPFGEGPRACLGQRFGLLQIKVGLAYVIKHYELSVNKKTKIPLTFDPVYLLLSPIGGLWLDLKKIC